MRTAHGASRRSGAVVALALALLPACDRAPQPAPTTPGTPAAVAGEPDVANRYSQPVFVCPMDKDVRSYRPGACPRCGMTLLTGVPDPVEYHLDLRVEPRPVPGQKVRLSFEVSDPWKGKAVTKFAVIHEKLFHAFLVSQDLEFFLHFHPDWLDGSFVADVRLPRPGMYRVLGDFYPEAATPQLLTGTVFVAGDEGQGAALSRDYATKQAANLRVSLESNPEQPLAREPTGLRFTLAPESGLERYLGAWAHLLAVSDDLIDMMHLHPSIADGSGVLQFDVTFPRPRAYRVWIELQRLGVVNTARFDVAVQAPPGAPAR
jgi:hypothetical protein